MTDEAIERIAARLLADDDARRPQALSAAPPDLTIAQAYRLQATVARLRQQRGERVIGYKVGCIGRAVQEQLGIHEPIFGRLFDSACWAAGTRLSCRRYANLAIEGELAVRLAHDLPASGLSDAECAQAIAVAFPVIELHSLVPRTLSCAELIACNGMHAGFVRGDTEARLTAVTDVLQELRVQINDEGLAAGAADNPLAALRWLAAALKEFGLTLARGQIVLTGSALPLLPIAPFPGRERPEVRVVVTTETLGTCRAEFIP